jgi:hypothetical protein
VISLNSNQIRQAPDFSGSFDTKYILGLATIDSRMMIVTDIERLMTSADMELIMTTISALALMIVFVAIALFSLNSISNKVDHITDNNIKKTELAVDMRMRNLLISRHVRTALIYEETE